MTGHEKGAFRFVDAQKTRFPGAAPGPPPYASPVNAYCVARSSEDVVAFAEFELVGGFV